MSTVSMQLVVIFKVRQGCRLLILPLQEPYELNSIVSLTRHILHKMGKGLVTLQPARIFTTLLQKLYTMYTTSFVTMSIVKNIWVRDITYFGGLSSKRVHQIEICLLYLSHRNTS